MNVLSWILFGLIAGALAKFIMPGKDPGGCLITVFIGIMGSVIGGFVGDRLFGMDGVTGFNVKSVGIAVLGSIILLLLYRLLLQKKTKPR